MATRQNELHVLVIEDNPGDVRLIEEGLKTSDVACDVTSIRDGGAALDHAQQITNGNHRRPDLTVLDIDMPGKDGRAILETLSEGLHGRSQILVLSGSNSEEHILETYALGADGYFIKPGDAGSYLSILHDAVESVSRSGSLPLGEFSRYEV